MTLPHRTPERAQKGRVYLHDRAWPGSMKPDVETTSDQRSTPELSAARRDDDQLPPCHDNPRTGATRPADDAMARGRRRCDCTWQSTEAGRIRCQGVPSMPGVQVWTRRLSSDHSQHSSRFQQTALRAASAFRARRPVRDVKSYAYDVSWHKDKVVVDCRFFRLSVRPPCDLNGSQHVFFKAAYHW